MIERTHNEGDTSSVAVYSDCEKYRYSLSRSWSKSAKRVTFIMLNPSQATEMRNDPTVERCERRARTLGFAGFTVVNIFAWRETDPKALRKAQNPIGAFNDDAILTASREASTTIAAWGTHGAHLDRGPQVARMLSEQGHRLHHLGLSKAGHPRHPLYLSYTVTPETWHSPYGV